MRGPCTPSTRSSSMSDVALGPETNVSGRPSAAAGRERGDRVGHRRVDGSASTRQTWKSGTSVSARRPLALAAVEHDRARLGDRQRAAREHAVEPVEPARRERRVVDARARAPAVVRRARRDREPARAVLGGTPPPRPPRARPRATRRTVARYSAARSQKRVDDLGSPGRRAAAGDAVVARDLGHGRARRRAPSAIRAEDLVARAHGARRAAGVSRVEPPASPSRSPTTRGRSAGHVGQLAHRRPARTAGPAGLRDRPAAGRASRCARS